MKDTMAAEADRFYKSVYPKVLDEGWVGVVNRWVHRTIEAKFSQRDYFESVLELGVGRGQHLRFVRHQYQNYVESDIRLELIPVRPRNQGSGIVTRKMVDAQSLKGVAERSVDRIIATCLLPHLPEPEDALREWRNRVRPGGSLSIHVTTNPSVLLRALRTITTSRKARAAGIDYHAMYSREHRYTFTYLKKIIEDCFSDDEITWKSYPFPLAPWNLSLWKVAHITVASGPKA